MWNNKGVPHQIYCPNNDYNPRKGKPICLYNGIWHALLHNKKGKFAVGQELPEVHDYDIPDKGKAREEEPPQTAKAKTLQEALVEEGSRPTTDPIAETPPDSPTITTESQESTTLVTQLRLAPVLTSIKTSPIASPLMTTATQTYTTTRRGGTPPPPFSGPPRAGSPAPPPADDGWGGGGDDGGGGGPPGGPGPGPNPPPAQQPQEVKLMGQLPAVFAGDRTLAESFINSLKAYFRLNHQAPNFQSYLTRIALALTLLQGPLVTEWARHTRNWLDMQDLAMDDTQDTWNQFETQFLTTFADSQRDQRAQNQLEMLRMKWPLIDQYTMDFKKLVREAGYQKGTPESIQMYIKGLPNSMVKDVLRPPLVHTYRQMVQQAVESVKLQELLASLDKMRGSSFRNTKPRGWQNFGTN